MLIYARDSEMRVTVFMELLGKLYQYEIVNKK